MSIASELNNYRNGLDDAWDAAEDMGATIPQDRNMVNLDDAIRTIPVSSPNDGTLTIQQNGTTIGTFTADQAANTTVDVITKDVTLYYISNQLHNLGGQTISVYTDAALTTTVSLPTIYAAAKNGGVTLVYGEGVPNTSRWTYDSVETYYDTDDDFYGVYFTDGYYQYVLGGNSTITVTVNRIQKELIAGSNITISGTYHDTISATDTTYSDFVGATSSVAGSNGLVPAPAAGDEGKALLGDGTWGDATAKLVEMSYGEANAWAKFIAAYNAGSIVYCRASSNANPGTGSQTRKAFMAYVNNATSPTSVEFQYVRSNSSKSDSSQCDQVFVYTLKNTSGGQWSVATRDMAPKINVSSPITKTFSGGANATITIGADAMTGATSSTAGAAGVVPKPNSGDQNKVLTGGGSWIDLTGDYSTTEVATPFTWVDGKTIYKQTFKTDNITQAQTAVTHGISNFGALVNAEGVMYTASQGYQPLDRVLPHLMSTWGWGLGDVQATTFTLFFGSGYTLSEITTWITLYYTKSS